MKTIDEFNKENESPETVNSGDGLTDDEAQSVAGGVPVVMRRTHTPVKDAGYRCTKCDKKYSMHGAIKSYHKCPICKTALVIDNFI